MSDAITGTARSYYDIWPIAYRFDLTDPRQAHEHGVLTITDTMPRAVSRSYKVEEQPATAYPGRVFLLAKVDHTGGAPAAQSAGERTVGGVYECRIPTVDTAFPSCTCKAGQTHAGQEWCVHVRVLGAMVRRGLPPLNAGLSVSDFMAEHRRLAGQVIAAKVAAAQTSVDATL